MCLLYICESIILALECQIAICPKRSCQIGPQGGNQVNIVQNTGDIYACIERAGGQRVAQAMGGQRRNADLRAEGRQTALQPVGINNLTI